jgi:hypothetical protein
MKEKIQEDRKKQRTKEKEGGCRIWKNNRKAGSCAYADTAMWVFLSSQ